MISPLYLRGIATRRIEAHLRELHGGERVSYVIANVADVVTEGIEIRATGRLIRRESRGRWSAELTFAGPRPTSANSTPGAIDVWRRTGLLPHCGVATGTLSAPPDQISRLYALFDGRDWI
jgi:hypothetical protein